MISDSQSIFNPEIDKDTKNTPRNVWDFHMKAFLEILLIWVSSLYYPQMTLLFFFRLQGTFSFKTLVNAD